MLAAGTRVGPYEIVSWLGAGGMGEVYRARDTKLHREVALKTLPEEFARQPDRLARLKHEARILASLNHPGIATLHGLEESNGGMPVLVMELVEGEALADRLRLGPLPVREALKVAHEIAVALEAAHEKGVLHRDLKPDNIRFGPGGRVKVLDFGLAKAVRRADVDSNVATATSPSRVGSIAGTAAYMSPEQARGHDLDRRSDVWAFGCVLYEILSGKRAFAGATFSDTLAAVLEREPDWEAMPPGTPPAVLRLLRRCLQKEKDKRLRDAGDARLELEELLVAPAPARGQELEASSARTIGGVRRESILKYAPWLVGAAMTGVGLWALLAPRPAAERPRVRLTIALAPESVGGLYSPAVAFSPDGTQLAYVATRDHRSQIYVRALDALESRAIPGTEGAEAPFFSPDSRWLGFFSGTENKIKRVLLSGSTPLAVCDAENARGATWSPDGTIVFSDSQRSPLYRVRADGGTAEALTPSIPAGTRRASGCPSSFRTARRSSSRSGPTTRRPTTTRASRRCLSERARDRCSSRAVPMPAMPPDTSSMNGRDRSGRPPSIPGGSSSPVRRSWFSRESRAHPSMAPRTTTSRATARSSTCRGSRGEPTVGWCASIGRERPDPHGLTPSLRRAPPLARWPPAGAHHRGRQRPDLDLRPGTQHADAPDAAREPLDTDLDAGRKPPDFHV
jgi:tRNA A-37 threonylcarbamoyl transferase component Bud32